MADDSQKNRNSLPKVPRRPGFQGWLIVGLILAVLMITWVSQRGSVREIKQKQFIEMVKAHEVAEVVIVNDRTVEITLTAEALRSPKYRNLTEEKSYIPGAQGPHFTFPVISAESFKTDVDKLNLQLPPQDQIDLRVDQRTGLYDFFTGWGFLILIVLTMYFMMSRMAGGGGPGGQIFNIGKSKAALFDADNKIKITFNDVAGLDEAKEEIKEIVEFLKTPKKFTDLGGKIPKGALLVGPVSRAG
ncbi:MAG: ATP-dependent metallopeptidase FtsH/Yme1/Tma family protein [Sphingobacteriaceae bacterium]|nr:ATP-dependent metallopeptidase FtsH/Yme1/Tma family protein [Cytophagaceae bacterium]